MTTATTTNLPRVLTPTAEYFPHDGAALVRLSPHQSLKNAALIYESIKNMPSKTLVRGDFDRKTRPFIFFPERTKKQIGLRGGMDTIASQNIEANRKEMHSFLSAIATDGFSIEKAHIEVRKASIELLGNCTRTMKSQKDFMVGDIKESLKILTKFYYADQLQKKTSPHRLLGKQISKIQNKRLRELVAIPGNTALDICSALRKDHVGKYDTRPEMAFYSIKLIVKNFLNQENTSSKSLANFLRQNAFNPDVQFFAKRWIAITFPKMTDERIQFSTEPWAKELDRICEIIVKSSRRSTQLKPIASSGAEEVSAQIVSQRSESKLLVLPKPDKLVYSSLNSEDTDDTSSFPSSPYQLAQIKSSSARSSTAASLLAVPTFPHTSENSNPVFTKDPISDDLQNESEQEGLDNAQSTLSPTAINKLSVTLNEKFDYQSMAISRRFLPIQESDEGVENSEHQRLLNDVPDESDQVIENSNGEEKL